ncbi:TonB-dependent receptor [Alteromonas sediminis]|uniref:TonB-dependent receptor n=1 Tax=Alteromonas sediminis TaxID=2259342 RepID=A0A3N5Y5P6_9ALTE|nr:TonB-dependent receptor [Alteromonas sediminis]RPJ68486.1 TonB-dependent receptor [Alteromonas sediminis]
MKSTPKNIRTKSFIPSILAASVALSLSPGLLAQSTDTPSADDEKSIEKIAVVGTQIRGGKMSEALAVSVMDAEDIAELGIDSGDELLDLIPENGQNFFNEAENISGGVNAARGDVGAFNLRNLGTGNTLVLLNGRRLVNAASYQTEEVGGSFVPVNSVNSNTIPVAGLSRVEVLRDGASAIYGADAVAGVVNHVLKTDFEGFNVRLKRSEYDNLPAANNTVTFEMGKNFNDGRTNVSAFVNYYDRDRINSLDDERWANSDFRGRLPEGSPWADSTDFRNDTANSLFGRFDIIPGNEGDLDNNNLVDSAGEFHVYPLSDPACSDPVAWQINEYTCGVEDQQRNNPGGYPLYRLNYNSYDGIGRDLRSDLQRFNFFTFVNHQFENGVESFTEFSYYKSKTNLIRHASAAFSTSELVVAAENYYNPFGVAGSPNRLPESITGDFTADGFDIVLDNYRFAEFPRIVDNDGDSFRFLQGFRGYWGDWFWDTALMHSEAEKTDITRNRVSNTLMQEALNDPTPAAYNPFSGGINSNIERALIDVTRESKTEITLFDFKASHDSIFELPGGDVGILLGFEWRDESFVDDRDPRLDGTIVFTDKEGDTYPFVSDVVNSSPTPDNAGDRQVTSLFTELQLPILDNLDVQAALRFEDFSDVGSTTVGKVAFGYRPAEWLLVRGSWSEAFRAPNLVTVNEDIVARNNSRTDWTCVYAAENGGDPDQDVLDCNNSIQRIAQGSDQLKPEESENTSIGLVFTPTENLTVTLDFWSIDKENTIGLFGEENHTLLDLIRRLESGGSCNTNPAVSRDPVEAGSDEEAIYLAAGLCPAGDIKFIDDRYANLDRRIVEGHDLGVYYDFETAFGDFNFKFNASWLDKFEQEAGGDAAILVEAAESGLLPESYPIDGFADLIGRDGNQEKRYSFKLNWRQGDWGASFSSNYIGDFYQSSLTLDDGTRYIIPSMTTYDATVSYNFDVMETRTRVRFGVRNLTDERAPLADRFFGYFADAHRDYGRSYYLDVKAFF